MPEQISNPTPDATQTATPATGPANGTVGTVDPTRNVSDAPTQSDQTAPDETFTSSVDPKSLSPKERKAYDNMLSDYKKKTAEIAQQRREWEQKLKEAEEKAQRFDQISSDEEFVTYCNQRQEQAQSSQGQHNGSPEMAPIDPVTVKREVDVLKANLLIKDFKTKPGHEDFDELEQNQLISGYIERNPPRTEKEWNDRLEKAYAWAKSLKQNWYESGRKSALQRIDEKVSSSVQPPTSSPAPAFSGDPKKLSVAEAVDLAKRGIKVRK